MSDCLSCGMDIDSCRYSRDHSNDQACCSRCDHSAPHRSEPKGTCRACGGGVTLRFIPGDRDQARQAYWLGYCRCGCADPVMAVCDDYRTAPFSLTREAVP